MSYTGTGARLEHVTGRSGLRSIEITDRETEAAPLFRNVLGSVLDSPSRWLLRRGRPADLSPALSRVLGQATEQLLSRHLTFVERRAVFQAALERLRRSPPLEQRELCDHLDLLDRFVPLLGRLGRRFETLSPESRRKCLQACERSRWSVLSEGHAKLRHLVQMAYMECPEAWPRSEPAREERRPQAAAFKACLLD
jgi:hypothetical protein